jgi:hypothetical protein
MAKVNGSDQRTSLLRHQINFGIECFMQGPVDKRPRKPLTVTVYNFGLGSVQCLQRDGLVTLKLNKQ